MVETNIVLSLGAPLTDDDVEMGSGRPVDDEDGLDEVYVCGNRPTTPDGLRPYEQERMSKIKI